MVKMQCLSFELQGVMNTGEDGVKLGYAFRDLHRWLREYEDWNNQIICPPLHHGHVVLGRCNYVESIAR